MKKWPGQPMFIKQPKRKAKVYTFFSYNRMILVALLPAFGY
jgi:hypothetical protein